MAILKDPAGPPPAKEIDSRCFIGAQYWLAEQQDADIATHELLVQILNEKYGGKNDEIFPQLVALQLKIKQDGKPFDHYIANFEDIVIK